MFRKILTAVSTLAFLAFSAPAAEMFTLKAAGQPTIAATDTPNGMIFRGFEGKPVLLNFFGKQCRYCKKEIPHLVALKKKYGDKIGIIGVHVQERMNAQERAIFKLNYPYYEYDDNMAIVRHIGSRARFNGSIPFNVIFNGKGEVVEIIPGYLGEDDLKMIFSELLKS